MIDTMVVTFTLDPAAVIPDPGKYGYTKLVGLHSKEFLEAHGEGWTPVSHQILATTDTTISLTLLLVREITIDAPTTNESETQ